MRPSVKTIEIVLMEEHMTCHASRCRVHTRSQVGGR
jgi:hypothetical protein